jgi:hypothetical protein
MRSISRFVAAALAVALLGANAPSAAPPPPTNYIATCDTSPGRSPLRTTPQNVAIAHEAQRILNTPVPPLVVLRHFRDSSFSEKTPERVLLGDLVPGASHWWVATLTPDNHVRTITAPIMDIVKKSLHYWQFMSAYIVLNQYLAGDETHASALCANYFADTWNAESPALAHEFVTATQPAPATRDYHDYMQRAFARLPQRNTKGLLNPEYTKATVAKIGAAPAIQIVYRDPGITGDGFGTLSVVRIGTTPHTYMLIQDKPAAPLTPLVLPVCVMGDRRCANDYTWP